MYMYVYRKSLKKHFKYFLLILATLIVNNE